MAVRTLVIPWTTIVVNSTTGKFFPCTPYIDPATARKARFTFEAQVIVGDPKVRPAYQQADVEDAPSAYLTLGTARTTSGVQYPSSMETLTDSEASQLTRFGFEGGTDASSSLAVMRVDGKVEVSD